MTDIVREILRPKRIVGKINGFESGFYKFVATDGTPRPLDILYLNSVQLRTAKIGNRVALEYRMTASRGEWVVAEVL